MTIATKLTALNDVKLSLKTALEGKGVDTSSSDFAGLAAAVESLPSGLVGLSPQFPISSRQLQ
jgi:hypothetical protein